MTTAKKFINIAHRGASSYAPENTYASYDKALDMGIRHVELDVHFTSDDHIVVIHDNTVDRTTNGSGPVSSFTTPYSPKTTAWRNPTLRYFRYCWNRQDVPLKKSCT